MTNYIYKNPHPKGLRVGDCVKRAITLASGKDYRQVSLELNRLKRKLGLKAFNSRENWKTYITEELHGKKISFPAIKGKDRITGKTFANYYPKGTYILKMAKHICCCINGTIYDTWDCREKCVYLAYKIGD